jgi:hypothetical protein
MIRKISKHLKRRGAHHVKILFSIDVQTVSDLLPALSAVGNDAILSVCFESGVYVSNCHARPVLFEVKQTLSLVATLYQETSGTFQDKTAKLILRQAKTSRLLGWVYKILGVVDL